MNLKQTKVKDCSVIVIVINTKCAFANPVSFNSKKKKAAKSSSCIYQND